MKTINEINSSKIPLVVIDKKLNNLDDMILFPEKVKAAKKILKKIGLPKQKHYS